MNIINWKDTDYHIHSINFSDWLNTIEEIVQYAWMIWLKEIAITDHSDIVNDYFIKNMWANILTWRNNLKTWENVWNDVKVNFWVEADLINRNWDICDTIQGVKQDFVILSLHKDQYKDDFNTITEWLINACLKYKDKIKCICHPYGESYWAQYIDFKKLVEVTNDNDIAIELNWSIIRKWSYKEENLSYILKNSKKLMINSDAHNLIDIKKNREFVWNYLKENWYI